MPCEDMLCRTNCHGTQGDCIAVIVININLFQVAKCADPGQTDQLVQSDQDLHQ